MAPGSARLPAPARHGRPRARRDQIKLVVDDRGFDSIRRFLPDQEIYLTGGATTAAKPLSEINSVKIVIVVPDGTTAKNIAELETRPARL